jgi:hypothetical protein
MGTFIIKYDFMPQKDKSTPQSNKNAEMVQIIVSFSAFLFGGEGGICCPPPSHSRRLAPAHARLCRLLALGGFASLKTILNRF